MKLYLRVFCGALFAASLGVAGSAELTANVFGACEANPLEKLNGTNWAFEIHDSNRNYVLASSAIGRFTATIRNGQGVLDLTETYIIQGQVTRGATASGRYTVYSDCSGGELFLNVRGFALQLEYVFDRNDRLQLVVDSAVGSTDFFGTPFPISSVMTGTARLLGPLGCPAGVADPLQLLTGNPHALQTLMSNLASVAPRFLNAASVGTFVASVRNGYGVIDAIETVNDGGSVTRRAVESGRFQVYSDCSGGEILLMNRTPPVQLEFVFATPDRSETFLLSDHVDNAFQLLRGTTKRRTVLTCPTNPVDLLNGSSWSFQVEGSNTFAESLGVIGRFTATVRGGQGFLDISQTSRFANNVNRLQGASGRYQVYSDCSGGELMFMVNGQAVQYEFIIVNENELYLVSDSVVGQLPAIARAVSVVAGSAIRNPPSACPAGVNPLQVMAGTTWVFRTYSNYLSGDGYGPPQIGSASVGYFTAGVSNGLGVLSAVETTNDADQITRLQQESGRYIVYPDCSGGEIMLMNRAVPVQLEFVFIGPNFDDMFLLSDSTTPQPGVNIQGRARRQ